MIADTKGCCIFVRTFFQGPVPVVSDEEDRYVVFENEEEAQREIAEYVLIRRREFGDEMGREEYLVPVTVRPDGSFIDPDGRCFGPFVE